MSSRCVYEHIYRRVLGESIFRQKLIRDQDVHVYGVSGLRRRDPETWWKLMGSSTRVFVEMSPCWSPHKFPPRFRIPAPEPRNTVKINILISDLFLTEYWSAQYSSIYMLIYTTARHRSLCLILKVPRSYVHVHVRLVRSTAGTQRDFPLPIWESKFDDVVGPAHSDFAVLVSAASRRSPNYHRIRHHQSVNLLWV